MWERRAIHGPWTMGAVTSTDRRGPFGSCTAEHGRGGCEDSPRSGMAVSEGLLAVVAPTVTRQRPAAAGGGVRFRP